MHCILVVCAGSSKTRDAGSHGLVAPAAPPGSGTWHACWILSRARCAETRGRGPTASASRGQLTAAVPLRSLRPVHTMVKHTQVIAAHDCQASCSAITFSRPSVADALLAFATAARGTNARALPDWLPGTDYCNWSGVGCDDGAAVTALRLPRAGLRGQLAPDLALLTTLQTMCVAGPRRNAERCCGSCCPKLECNTMFAEHVASAADYSAQPYCA